MIKNKYAFDILCRNGIEVKNIKVTADTLDEAKHKVRSMYRYCEFTKEEVCFPHETKSYNYDDILGLITK